MWQHNTDASAVCKKRGVKKFTVKVESSGTVLVDLLDDVVEVLVGQLVVQLLQDLLQRVG